MGQFNPFENSGSGSGDVDTSAYATDISMSMDSRTYIMYISLKNEEGNVIGREQKIDLPLETMVVGGSYDDNTKKVILTLKNGNTVDFSVADLVDGLQPEITSTNKLNSDLVDDTNQNNKFVTSAEKTKIAKALTEEVYNAGKQVKTGNNIGEIFNKYGGNKATGNYSHAEGNGTTASGGNSHAEGNGTKASNHNSHAEGMMTTASGSNSHAEGSGTTASGSNSHAEGNGTLAASSAQHVQGKYNIEDSNSKYAFIIGNGTDSNNRSNAFAVDWDGKIYVNNSETGVDVSQLQPIINSSNKLSADLVDDTSQNNKFVTSAEKTKIANALTEEVYNAGKQVKTGNNIGEVFNNYTDNKASGSYSHAEGGSTTASGIFSHAEGSFTIASGESSHAEGTGTIAASNRQHVQGEFNIEDSNNKFAFIIGNGTTAKRSNALAVDWEGKIYVNNSETGVNVSVHNSALIGLIDSGQKNLASVNSGTFTAPTTPDGARYVSIPVIRVSGDVVLYTGSLESDDTTVTTCGLRLQFADGATQTIQINRGSNIVTNISLEKELTEIGIYPANGYTASAGKSLSFQNLMLCSKAAWDISQNYVPYRPSYDELVAKITALENA